MSSIHWKQSPYLRVWHTYLRITAHLAVWRLPLDSCLGLLSRMIRRMYLSLVRSSRMPHRRWKLFSHFERWVLFFSMFRRSFVLTGLSFFTNAHVIFSLVTDQAHAQTYIPLVLFIGLCICAWPISTSESSSPSPRCWNELVIHFSGTANSDLFSRLSRAIHRPPTTCAWSSRRVDLFEVKSYTASPRLFPPW